MLPKTQPVSLNRVFIPAHRFASPVVAVGDRLTLLLEVASPHRYGKPMSNSKSKKNKRSFLLSLILTVAMALVGSGMFLASYLQGKELTGTAFNLGWILLSQGILLTPVWWVGYVRANRKSSASEGQERSPL